MHYVYRALALIVLGAAFITGTAGQVAVMWMSFAAFLVLLLLSHKDDLKSFSAGLTGVSATMHEAKKVTQDAREAADALRQLAAETARIALSIVERTGRVGGFSDPEKQRFVESLVEALRRAGASEALIDSVRSETRRFREFDHRLAILDAFPMTNRGSEAALRSSGRIRARPPIEGVTPEELAELVSGLRLDCPFAADLIEDYRHLLRSGTQRRPDVWKARDHWQRDWVLNLGEQRGPTST